MLNVRPCDTCRVLGGMAHHPIMNVCILGAAQEFVYDPPDSIAGPKAADAIRYFTISEKFSIVFLPDRVGTSDTTLPLRVRDFMLPYTKLEFSVWKNGQLQGNWKPVASLGPETTYAVSFKNTPEDNLYKRWKTFQAGEYQLKPGEHVLLKVRQISTDSVLEQVYVHRLKAVPQIESAFQFPANTDIQEILNGEIAENTWLLNEDELEIYKGHSLLLRFDKGMDNQRMIEISYNGATGSWQKISPSKDDAVPGFSQSFYLFIREPDDPSKRNLYLRYSDQPETIKHIKIIIKPVAAKSSWIKIAASIVLAALLFMVGFLFNNKRNEKQLQKLQRHKEELENKLQLLSGQFNPHFLFNTLNSIQNLVQKNETDKAADYISTVAAFLRTVMTISKKEYISLSEELDINETYLKLEQNRKRFHYEIIRSCSLDLGMIDFPPLLLQPVLENSIHHGIDHPEENALHISITIRCDEKNIEIVVKDNGKGYDTTAVKNGYGLDLAERRIKMINEVQPGRMLMQVNSSEKGTETIFMLKDWI